MEMWSFLPEFPSVWTSYVPRVCVGYPLGFQEEKNIFPLSIEKAQD